ncbi:hypothetical protein ACFL6U_12790 [Planctomycetota bacterium]
MRVWTWQKEGFDITGSRPVDSARFSDYFGPDWHPDDQARFRQAYQMLWDILGTDQFHWYYIQQADAEKRNSINENKLLWTVEVPDNQIFRVVCTCAWSAMRNERVYMPRWDGVQRLKSLGRYLKPEEIDELKRYIPSSCTCLPYWEDLMRTDQWQNESSRKKLFGRNFDRTFNKQWSDMDRDELKKRIFVSCKRTECTQILLQHPIPIDWVCGDPIPFEELCSSVSG